MLLYKIEQNNLQKTINSTNISISTVSVDTYYLTSVNLSQMKSSIRSCVINSGFC